MRGGKQQVAFPLCSEPDRPQLRLAGREGGGQLALALLPVIVFADASENPHWNLRRAIRFIIGAVRRVAYQGAQHRMLALNSRERGADLLHVEAALKPDEAGDIDVDDSFDMGQFPSHEVHIIPGIVQPG